MAKNNEEIFKNVISHAKEYGFVFQSSEIYDGLSAVYDYGQLGAELKNNIKTYWWKAMVQMNKNIVGLDSAIFMHPKVWKASGHVDGFSDPMIDNKDSNKRYRADQLIEDKITFYEGEGEKEKAAGLQYEMDESLKSENLPRLKELIEEHKIACPVSKTANWTDVRQFNLMFATQFGAMAVESEEVYLRPETAQGIFINFQNVLTTSRRTAGLVELHDGSEGLYVSIDARVVKCPIGHRNGAGSNRRWSAPLPHRSATPARGPTRPPARGRASCPTERRRSPARPFVSPTWPARSRRSATVAPRGSTGGPSRI